MKNKKIVTKAKNKSPIRILYKKANQSPEVRIINSVFDLKKSIINNSLKLIPYEYGKIIIICNNEKISRDMQPNIVLTLDKVLGDLLLVKFDRKSREFIDLSQEDILWYSEDLINKSFNNHSLNSCKNAQNKVVNFFKNADTKVSNSFEVEIITTLEKINLTLSKLLKRK